MVTLPTPVVTGQQPPPARAMNPLPAQAGCTAGRGARFALEEPLGQPRESPLPRWHQMKRLGDGHGLQYGWRLATDGQWTSGSSSGLQEGRACCPHCHNGCRRCETLQCTLPTAPMASTYSRTLCDDTRVSLASGGGSWRECSLVITRTPPRESNLNGNFSSGHAMNICKRHGEMVYPRASQAPSTAPCWLGCQAPSPTI